MVAELEIKYVARLIAIFVIIRKIQKARRDSGGPFFEISKVGIHELNEINMSNYQVDERGFYGEFGGAYVPEILYKCVSDLQEAYLPIIESEEFKQEYHALLKDYVGRTAWSSNGNSMRPDEHEVRGVHGSH